MRPAGRGYFEAVVDDVPPSSRYFLRLDGDRDRPDPASRYQPEGVHGPSEVVAMPALHSPAWRGLPLHDYIFYELHVGTFTPEGTFESAVKRLDELRELGITAVELMPLAQFPGSRNWGYDGVYPYAVQNSYGGPQGLRAFVRACHDRGLAVVLDVVYNHLGPEGNYLNEFGPYFTGRYRTLWGDALNFDGPDSDEVRAFFLENALYWIGQFELDGLRLDAVHTILDHSAHPFLQQLAETVHDFSARQQRRIYLFPESDLNDARLVTAPELGGLGLDAQWNDDFHHALHTLLTGERDGYYADFEGFAQLGKAYREGYIYSGQFSAARGRRHGNSSRDLAGSQLIVFSQNHDQVGNRVLGQRLGHLVSFESAKLAAGAVLLSPFLPLLFMGEEYGETAPFLYFVSHSDPPLVEAVRRGRKEEFAAFNQTAEPPDPQGEETFRSSKLNPGLAGKDPHRTLRAYYQELIRLRKTIPALAALDKNRLETTVYEKRRVLVMRRWAGESQAVEILNFGDEPSQEPLPVPPGCWKAALDSADARWLGPGSGMPRELSSDGEPDFKLAARSLVLLEKI